MGSDNTFLISIIILIMLYSAFVFLKTFFVSEVPVQTQETDEEHDSDTLETDTDLLLEIEKETKNSSLCAGTVFFGAKKAVEEPQTAVEDDEPMFNLTDSPRFNPYDTDANAAHAAQNTNAFNILEDNLAKLEQAATQIESEKVEPEHSLLFEQQNSAQEQSQHSVSLNGSQTESHKLFTATSIPESEKTIREKKHLSQSEQIIALTLLPNYAIHFTGLALLEAFKKHGLHFGTMNLFHRHQELSGEGDIQFSILRYSSDKKPKEFNLQRLATETVEGLTIFMALPHPNAIEAVECYTTTLTALAEDLQGSLFDDSFNKVSKEYIEQINQAVKIYVEKTSQAANEEQAATQEQAES